MGPTLILIIVAVVFVTFSAILKRYKRCPSDKILVIYGKTGKNREGGISSARCIHGGASFIWPVFQSYSFLDLTPISIECNLTNALSKQNIRVDVPCRFTVGISTENGVMQNAAERLLGLKLPQIQELADTLFLWILCDDFCFVGDCTGNNLLCRLCRCTVFINGEQFLITKNTGLDGFCSTVCQLMGCQCMQCISIADNSNGLVE